MRHKDLVGVVLYAVISALLFLAGCFVKEMYFTPKVIDYTKKVDSLYQVITIKEKKLDSILKENSDLENKKTIEIKYVKEQVDIIRNSPYDSAVKHLAIYLSKNGKNKR